MKNMKLFQIVLSVFCLFSWGMWSVIQAATINVTTTEDNVPGSLRAAITAANSNSEDDTINLPAGIYLLIGEAGEDANASGDLDIDTGHTISIIGEGMTVTFIDGNRLDRVLHVLNGTVSITGVTIRNGRAGVDNDAKKGEDGGGIYNQGTLTLSNCTISNSHAGDGEAVTGSGGDGGNGGGIFNDGNLTMSGCTINNNHSGPGAYHVGAAPFYSGKGGGVYNSGTLNLDNCTISKNRTGGLPGGEGGGIFSSSSVNLTQCTINDNSSGGGADGGGIFNQGNITLTGCTVNNNRTGDSVPLSDVEMSAGSGGGIHNRGSIILTHCLINNNETGDTKTGEEPPTSGGAGGGIYHRGIETTLTNCTISNNRTGEGGTFGGNGGGIFSGDGLTLINCTVCDNSSGNGDYDDGFGGGIFVSNDVSNDPTIKNTIIANNQVGAKGKGPDFYGTFNSLGYNLVEDITDCTVTGDLTGVITGQDPRLAPLGDNGGPTNTHALLLNSPAIDAGNSAGITEDQRGSVRPVDIPSINNVSDGSDMGAYELNPSYTVCTVSGRITLEGTGFPEVTLDFSNNRTTTTDENGYYSYRVQSGWSGTVTPGKNGYTFTPASRTYTVVTTDQPDQDYTAAAIPTLIFLSRTQLNFGVAKAGGQTGSQSFLISGSSWGILKWTISDDAVWLDCTPTSGSNSELVMVTVDASGLSPGTYTATISVEDPNAANSPQTVTVILTVYASGAANPPFGSFETPVDNSTVMSSIPVTGWVLDDIGVDTVKIYRGAAIGETEGWVYIGDAVLVEGARPDVEAAYPGYPSNYKAGWGYMLLTNALPNQGNGTFTILAKAADKEGNTVALGTKTIYCDNANAVKPFGAIDTPAQGGMASGSQYINFGWALTPIPNRIPTDGSTITVWVDGVPLGHPVYNRKREDIAALFPGYENSNSAGGYFYLDTTQYENGVHTIAWSVIDNAGNTDGIGSRYFSILNSAVTSDQEAAAAGKNSYHTISQVTDIPVLNSSPVGFKTGYNQNIAPKKIYPDDNNNIKMEIEELTPIEIRLFPGKPVLSCSGYQMVGQRLRPLPPGSTLDPKRGIFYWLPGPGFNGNYDFLFTVKALSGEMQKRYITIKIFRNQKIFNHEVHEGHEDGRQITAETIFNKKILEVQKPFYTGCCPNQKISSIIKNRKYVKIKQNVFFLTEFCRGFKRIVFEPEVFLPYFRIFKRFWTVATNNC